MGTVLVIFAQVVVTVGAGANVEEATYDRLDTDQKDTNTGSAARCKYTRF
jgi:hypothetical protein